jgi:SAM-dependent methyltransferase
MLGNTQTRQVKTTTWPLRHEETFTQFRHYLSETQQSTPAVLEVGPGAATKLLAPFYPAPRKGKRLPWLAGHWRFLIRKFDSVLRRIPGIELCSFEVGELRVFLPEDVNHHVADISAEVITAVQKQYPEVTARVHDFSNNLYPQTLDAVVCLCVLVRAKEPQKLFENIYNSLKPGGLLVMDNRSVRLFGGEDFPLESLSNQVFRKLM